jgi:hypothetical protein
VCFAPFTDAASVAGSRNTKFPKVIGVLFAFYDPDGVTKRNSLQHLWQSIRHLPLTAHPPHPAVARLRGIIIGSRAPTLPKIFRVESDDLEYEIAALVHVVISSGHLATGRRPKSVGRRDTLVLKPRQRVASTTAGLAFDEVEYPATHLTLMVEPRSILVVHCHRTMIAESNVTRRLR